MTGPERHTELAYRDAEDWRDFVATEDSGRRSKRQPLTGTAGELAAARMRAADTLAPAVQAAARAWSKMDDLWDYRHALGGF